MDANELEDMIGRLFPEKNETELLAAIGKEIERTEEFRKLVRFRKEHPALTIPETEISLWAPGLDRGDYADPYWISESEERIYTEYRIPAAEEYAGFADYASRYADASEIRLNAMLTVSRTYQGLNRMEPHPIDISRYPALDRLFAELEDLGRRKIAECVRLTGARPHGEK